ncbi:MAG: hypothetical protein ACR2OB_03685 [Solirubrobacteraceae bacterium]
MTWLMNPDALCSEEGCSRPRAVGSDLCLACQQGCGALYRRLAEREEPAAEREEPAAERDEPAPSTLDLENWPVLPED